MLSSIYYCKPVTVQALLSVSEYIFNQYKDTFEKKNDSYPIHLNSKDTATLNLILKEDKDRWFSGTEAKLVTGIIFFLRPFERQPIHIDSQTNFGIYTSLNIPLQNCEGGDMGWYAGSYHEEDKILSSGIKYKELHISNPTILFNKIINEPHVVRTNIPHNVNNTIGKQRSMLALRFDKNIPELET